MMRIPVTILNVKFVLILKALLVQGLESINEIIEILKRK